MASKIKAGLEKINVNTAKALGAVQVGIDKVLWGKNNTNFASKPVVLRNSGTKVEATTDATTIGTDIAKSKEKAASTKKQLSNPLDLGIYPILDLLNEVNICNVLQYALSKVNNDGPKARKEAPTSQEKALYAIQDQAALVQKGIDQFLAFPNSLISSYTGVGPKVVAQKQVQTATAPQTLVQSSKEQSGQAGTPGAATSGTNAQRFNIKNLIDYIKGVFSTNLQVEDGKSLFTPEDLEILESVTGLSQSTNIINDFLNSLDKYADYRNISNNDLQKLLRKINTLRIICVGVQRMDFKSPASILNFLPPANINAQLAKIEQYFKPAKIVPVIKKINDTVRSFINMVRKAQGLLKQGQFIVKIAVVLLKVFKFIIKFLKAIPISGAFTTLGATLGVGSVLRKAEALIDDLIDTLAQVNSLLALVISFMRYIQANTQQLIQRLGELIDNLASCDSFKDSPLLLQLQQTLVDLKTLDKEVSDYLSGYDEKRNPTKTVFATYTIQVIEEETTDTSILNKRRRGVALDSIGRFVLQSDLTFATDLQTIIGEVKIKLISKGLVQPGLGQFDANASIISDTLSFLEENDLIEDDLNLELEDVENPDSEDDNKGLGLQAFINKLPGGKKLRKRTRKRLARAKALLKAQIDNERNKGIRLPAVSDAKNNTERGGGRENVIR